MLVQIGVPVLVLTAVMLGLAGLVLLARSWLEPHGIVEIDVNAERCLEVNAGGQLLWALAEHEIYLPAACGGRGSCGQCRVRVLAGGGPVLPTEAVHIEPHDAEAGMRLACMVKVRGPMRIELPPETLGARRWMCRVVSNRNVATYLKELTLRLPEGEHLDFTAGDYMLLEAPAHRIAYRDLDIDDPYREEWAGSGLFDLESITREPTVRAYSLANPPQQSDRAVLVVRIAPPPPSAPTAPPGRASSFIFGCKAGDAVSISGPFGDFHVADGECEVVFIAGGAGIAPIRSMILDQFARGSSRKMSFWYGCRDAHDLCYYDELAALAREHERFGFHVALSSPRADDRWSGYTGFIHTVVYEAYLKDHPAPQALEYYLCGPPLMSAAVVDMLESLGVEREQIFFDDFGS